MTYFPDELTQNSDVDLETCLEYIRCPLVVLLIRNSLYKQLHLFLSSRAACVIHALLTSSGRNNKRYWRRMGMYCFGEFWQSAASTAEIREAVQDDLVNCRKRSNSWTLVETEEHRLLREAIPHIPYNRSANF